MQSIWLTLFSTLLGVVFVYSQPIVLEDLGLTISDTCVETVRNVMTSPEGECLNLAGLLTLFVINKQDSVINPINAWLENACSLGQCPDGALTNMVAAIMTGCREEIITYTGALPEDIQDDVNNIVLQVYPVAREALCLVDNTSDKLCVTQTLTNVESVFGTLNKALVNEESIFEGTQAIFQSGISDLTCTPCIKQAYNLANQAFPSIVSNADPVLEDVCGAEFIDGVSPNNITSSAAAGGFTPIGLNKNGALKVGNAPWLLTLWAVAAVWF